LLRELPNDKDILAALALVASRGDRFGEAAALYARAGRPAKAEEAAALAAAPAYQADARRDPVIVPFLQEDPLPTVKVDLGDGKNHVFVLDTGAAETILDPRLADKLGVVPFQDSEKGVFAGGKTAGQRFALLAKLRLGDLTVRRIPVTLLDTTPISAALGSTPVEGVIGVDILRRFTATLDYPRRRLSLARPEPQRARTSHGVRFWLAADHYLLAESAIDGRRELALVDTGLAGQGCTAPLSTIAGIGVAEGRETVEGAGGGGAVRAGVFHAATLSLADKTQTNVSCLFGPFPEQLETSTGARIGLLVSHAFLKAYAVKFDFAAMRLTLRRERSG
jgi:predicted aspartyl protease